MERLEREVVSSLSEPARRLFFSLDKRGQERLLKQAKELVKQNDRKKRQKERYQRKSIRKLEIKKKTGQGKTSGKKEPRNYGKAYQSAKESMITVMHVMLLGESTSEQMYDSQSSSGQNTLQNESYIPKHLAGKAGRRAKANISRRLRKTASNKIRAKATRKGAKASARTLKTTVKAVGHAVKAGGKAVSSVMAAIATNPVVWIVLLIVILVVMIVGAIGAIIGSGGAANSENSSSYQAQVSEKTEGYRELVSQYCEKYEIDDYVDLCLAMIEQESGGNPPDVMQTEQSYYNTHPPIDSAEESIDCGTHELSDCLKKAKCKDPSDIQGISLAIQGYNFGNGYIDWAIKNYNGYTKESAETFSKKMCAELGYKRYGDTDYVPHVLRYYIANPETTVSNESAKTLIKELKENNQASREVWQMIEKGASLIGSVTYSMDKRQTDGSDSPQFLDCSAFTAWSFHKSGISSVAYSSNTGTFISSKKFVDVAAKDLKPGDIGLKSRTAPTGGANHVGIYCGQLKNGTKVWLHCTSSSSTSLTGNNSGVMLGAYTNFTYFRRLKKWSK